MNFITLRYNDDEPVTENWIINADTIVSARLEKPCRSKKRKFTIQRHRIYNFFHPFTKKRKNPKVLYLSSKSDYKWNLSQLVIFSGGNDIPHIFEFVHYNEAKEVFENLKNDLTPKNKVL